MERQGSVLAADGRLGGRADENLDEAGRAVEADPVPVLDLLGSHGRPDDGRDAELAGEDGRVGHGPARVVHDAYDLCEYYDPGRVLHLADEDVSRPDIIELVLAEDDPRDALDDARRAAEPVDLAGDRGFLAVELVGEAPQVQVREGELRRGGGADPL